MIDLKDIEAIIFDLGGVIINIDYQLTIDAFERLGVQNFIQQYSKKNQSKLFDLLEVGKISNEQFVQTIKNDLKISHCSNHQIVNAWNSLLLDFPVKRLNLLKELKQKFKTFLLSNTNNIHIDAFQKILKNQTGYASLDPYFHKVYFSSKIGFRKPDNDVFEYVLSHHNLVPNKTLFIDDSIQHIVAAKKLGIQTHHLKDTEDIVTLLS